MKRVALHTLGCKLNYAETADIGKKFVAHGYTVVCVDDPADVVVINSCSVTLHAERECRQIIRRALRCSPDAFVAVVGCYAQLQSEQIAAINGIDLVLGSKEKNSLFDFINGHKKKPHADIFISCIDDNNDFGSASTVGFDKRTRAFVKIQDGCDYNCAYCTIPLARGKSRSTTIAEILLQAREAVEQGYKEIVLTGVNVGDYGKNDGSNLLELLKQLVNVDGMIRLRISSIEPNLLTDELLDFWFANEKICNHWHIPLQSGSDAILQLMRRRYRKDMYTKRVEQIKSNIPDAGIGADVIVGFPGEDQKMFEETYNVLNELPLTYFHVFNYSERPNTYAKFITPKIPPSLRAERSEKLRGLSIHKRQEFYRRHVGKTLPVLFESMHPEGTISGLTEEYVRVDVKLQSNLINKIVNVTIEEALAEKCKGKLADEKITSEIRIAI